MAKVNQPNKEFIPFKIFTTISWKNILCTVDYFLGYCNFIMLFYIKFCLTSQVVTKWRIFADILISV